MKKVPNNSAKNSRYQSGLRHDFFTCREPSFLELEKIFKHDILLLI